MERERREREREGGRERGEKERERERKGREWGVLLLRYAGRLVSRKFKWGA